MAYISFVKNRKKIVNRFPKCDYTLNEALGSFDTQQEEAERISRQFVEMYKEGLETQKTTANIGGEEIRLLLSIEKTRNLVKKTEANIQPFGDKHNDGSVTLEYLCIKLYISQFDIKALTEEELTKKITSVVSHELLHGNIFSKRIASKQNIGAPDWYEGIINIIDTAQNDEVYNFAYAIYACYYEEKQAIISSTYTQLLEKYPENRLNLIANKVKKMNNDEEIYNYLLKLFKIDLVNNENFQTYSYLKDFCKDLSSNNNPALIFLIHNIFAKEGLELDVKETAEQLSIIATNALKDVNRNASLFFHNFLLSRFLNEKKNK